MRRVGGVVLLAVLLLGPGAALARDGGHGFVWAKHRVKVIDRLPREWQADVEAQLAAWNAIMPKKAPTFVYVRGEPGPCADHEKRHNVILLCDWPEAYASGLTTSWQEGHTAWGVILRVPLWARQWPAKTLCIELGHALLGTNDPASWGERSEESCTDFDGRDTPGPWDQAYAKRVYNQERR